MLAKSSLLQYPPVGLHKHAPFTHWPVAGFPNLPVKVQGLPVRLMHVPPLHVWHSGHVPVWHVPPQSSSAPHALSAQFVTHVPGSHSSVQTTPPQHCEVAAHAPQAPSTTFTQ